MISEKLEFGIIRFYWRKRYDYFYSEITFYNEKETLTFSISIFSSYINTIQVDLNQCKCISLERL